MSDVDSLRSVTKRGFILKVIAIKLKENYIDDLSLKVILWASHKLI